MLTALEAGVAAAAAAVSELGGSRASLLFSRHGSAGSSYQSAHKPDHGLTKDQRHLICSPDYVKEFKHDNNFILQSLHLFTIDAFESDDDWSLMGKWVQ